MSNIIPVITVDGPSGVGKGTLASRLALHLGWHFLDSGAIYRLLALAVIREKRDHLLQNENQLEKIARNLDITFRDGLVLLENQEVTEKVRGEQCGQVASIIAAYPLVRRALLEKQRAFQKWPGLVADGRDMGTVIFPDAALKFFLSASQEERTKRRYKQLKERGINVSLESLVQELSQRDQRDTSRHVAPLVPALDAILIDSTTLDKEAVFSYALKALEKMKR